MYILIDIGGTKTRVSVSQDKKTFKDPVIFETAHTFDVWLDALTTEVATLTEGIPPIALVAGIPGTLTQDREHIFITPHLPEWNGIAIAQKLRETFSCSVMIENDTALVGLGEAVYGKGKKYSIVAYITISTGVGGVRIVDGKIDRNTSGFEIGHQIIDADKTLEYYISGSSLAERYGISSKEIEDPLVWKDVMKYTIIGTTNTIMYWSPECIIYGGGVMNRIQLNDVTSKVKKIVTMYEKLPILLESSLGDVGGLYGGLAIIGHRIK